MFLGGKKKKKRILFQDLKNKIIIYYKEYKFKAL